MTRGAFASELRKNSVFVRGPSSLIVIFFQNAFDTLAFLRRVEGRRRNVLKANFFIVQLPGNKIDVSKTIQPGAFPGYEAFGVEFSRKHGVFGSQRLEFVQGDRVSHDPRRKWERKTTHHKHAN